MYTLRLTRLPENGVAEDHRLELALQELGLAEPFKGPKVQVRYHLTRMMEKVFGRVHAEAQAELECSHCLKGFETGLKADFDVQFEPFPGNGALAEDADAELPVSYHDGEELKLGEEIRQELELQLPFAPVCKEGCRGLCPRCGQDLNQGSCGC